MIMELFTEEIVSIRNFYTNNNLNSLLIQCSRRLCLEIRPRVLNPKIRTYYWVTMETFCRTELYVSASLSNMTTITLQKIPVPVKLIMHVKDNNDGTVLGIFHLDGC